MFSEERVSIEFDVTCVQIKIRVSVKMNSKWRGQDAGSVQCWPDHEGKLGDEICSPRKIGAYSDRYVAYLEGYHSSSKNSAPLII